jgi:hypothetical protein
MMRSAVLLRSTASMASSSRSVLSRSIRPATALPRPAIAQVAKRGYHEKVIDHYENPRNVGNMNKKDMDVGTGLVGAPACGE